MRTFLILTATLLFVHSSLYSQDKDEMAIRNILYQQIEAWNNGNLDQFMQGYWKNDSLLFIGKSSVSYGYDSALANYKRNYPDKKAMGTLVFHIIQIKKLSAEYYWVLGQWTLKREKDSPGGHYTLLFRKIHNHWVIVADHTS